jgi:beta-glucosidase
MRHYYNVDQGVDGRPLREIYLAAWSHLLRVSDPVAIMMAYVLFVSCARELCS